MKQDLELIIKLDELLLTKKKHELTCSEPKLGSLASQISKVRQRIPSALLSRFDKLARSYPDVVTVVEDRVCQGCGERLSHRLIAQAEQVRGDLVTCEHCGRFLLSHDRAPQFIH